MKHEELFPENWGTFSSIMLFGVSIPDFLIYLIWGNQGYKKNRAE